jgi:hypothetical protein
MFQLPCKLVGTRLLRLLVPLSKAHSCPGRGSERQQIFTELVHIVKCMFLIEIMSQNTS